MITMTNAYETLARLPLRIESYRLEPLEQAVSAAFSRHTTVVHLIGGSHEGVGEDPTYDRADQKAFQSAGAAWPLTGETTLGGFCEMLDGLELFPRRPSQEAYRQYRRWALESAACDLALSQSGLCLADALELRPRPLSFVVSMGLGNPSSAEPVRRLLERFPGRRLKLDASGDWDDRLAAEIRSLAAIDVVDFKGAYRGTPVDQPPDAGLYRLVAESFPDAWLEDPALTPETERVLAPHRRRITWDAPIHSVEDVRALPWPPRALNVKPSRFGSLAALFRFYDDCGDNGIALYGGGQFELGPGRGQIQYLAALIHPDGCNDVAPAGYNASSPPPGLPASPLTLRPTATGFRIDD